MWMYVCVPLVRYVCAYRHMCIQMCVSGGLSLVCTSVCLNRYKLRYLQGPGPYTMCGPGWLSQQGVAGHITNYAVPSPVKALPHTGI